MTAWQPIETAPKDGTDIIILFSEPPFGGGDTQIAVGFWADDADDWPEVEPWFASEADSKPLTAFGARATHWLSIPELPTEKAAP